MRLSSQFLKKRAARQGHRDAGASHETWCDLAIALLEMDDGDGALLGFLTALELGDLDAAAYGSVVMSLFVRRNRALDLERALRPKRRSPRT